MKCKHIKADGTQCETEALNGGDLCFFHAPEKAEERKTAQSNGGKASYYDKGLVKAETIDISEDTRSIIYLLSDTINRVRRVKEDGSIDIRTANCIGFLSSKILEAKKEIDLNERIEKLEKAIL